MYDETILSAATSAAERILADLGRRLPASSAEIAAWLEQVHHAPPAASFLTPHAFPLLLLPWFLEKAIQPSDPDLKFREDVVFTTMNLYYYLRFIDNIIDNDALSDVRLLPALSFFHVNLQTPLQKYFDGGHPFWDFFLRIWLHCADVTIADCSRTSFDAEEFVAIAAKKTSAAKIPLAAVCHRYGRQDLVEPWLDFHDVLGCWHQMWNDLRDWTADERNGIATYFLSHARQAKGPNETIAEWVIREGYDWGLTTLDGWMRRHEGPSDRSPVAGSGRIPDATRGARTSPPRGHTFRLTKSRQTAQGGFVVNAGGLQQPGFEAVAGDARSLRSVE